MSIRFKITRMMALLVALIILIWFFCFSILFQCDYTQQNITDAEHSLQLTAADISEKVFQLNSLAHQCAFQPDVTTYLRNTSATKSDATEAFDNMFALYSSHPMHAYIYRIVISDFLQKYLQAGAQYYLNQDDPSQEELIRQLIQTLPSVSSAPYCGTDSYGSVQTPSLRIIAPILVSGPRNYGVSYIAADPHLISDAVIRYHSNSETDAIYLLTGESGSFYDARTLEAVPEIQTKPCEYKFTMADSNTALLRCSEDGRLVLRYPIDSIEGMYLYRTIETPHFLPLIEYVPPFILILLIVLAPFASFFILYLYIHHIINHPIAALQSRLQTIATGDFSQDTSIEWHNEFGNIGHSINKLTHDISYLMECRVAEEKERQELEYRMLQHQISPHFIYNTLNTIRWMATIQNARGIAEMASSLSRLLRHIAKNGRQLISLQEELVILNDYSVIQRYRYGRRLLVEVEEISDEALCHCLIPAFTLQPIVENAIFHGIEPKESGGSILLKIHQSEPGDLEICIQDDGVGIEKHELEQLKALFEQGGNAEYQEQHSGLYNVHKRIRYAFGEAYGLSVDSRPGQGTCVTVRLPQCNEHI